jgi:hypothetical protein
MVSVVEKIILNQPACILRRGIAPQIQNHLAQRRKQTYSLGRYVCHIMFPQRQL